MKIGSARSRAFQSGSRRAPQQHGDHRQRHGPFAIRRHQFEHELVGQGIIAENARQMPHTLLKKQPGMARKCRAQKTARRPSRAIPERLPPSSRQQQTGGGQDQLIERPVNPGGRGNQKKCRQYLTEPRPPLTQARPHHQQHQINGHRENVRPAQSQTADENRTENGRRQQSSQPGLRPPQPRQCSQAKEDNQPRDRQDHQRLGITTQPAVHQAQYGMPARMRIHDKAVPQNKNFRTTACRIRPWRHGAGHRPGAESRSR